MPSKRSKNFEEIKTKAGAIAIRELLTEREAKEPSDH